MTQKNPTDEKQQTPQEDVLAYLFPWADHRLEVADPTIYEHLQAAYPSNVMSSC
jgi:hypothetical protein